MLRLILITLSVAVIGSMAAAEDNDTSSPFVTIKPPASMDESDTIFFGRAPFTAVPDTMSLNMSGQTDIPFLRSEVKWARTGRTTSPTKFYGNWGAIEAPAGLRLYAIRFSVGLNSQIEAERKNGIQVPEVAWCSPDIKPEKKKPYCFFKSRLGFDMIVGSSGAGSVFYPEYIGVGSTAYSLEERPEIVEAPVDFDKKLTLEVEIDKIKKSKVKFKVRLNDGEERSDIFSDSVKRSDDGKAIIELWGGSLEITPTGKKSFSVREITPIDPSLALDDERIFFPYSLRT